MRDSVAQRVAHYVETLPEGSFVAVRDIIGSRNAVETAFSRLGASGKLMRIRKGTYWKGTFTPLGISPPRTEEVALFLGGSGAGPAGVAAAHYLGLTSQVPSTYLTAVPGRAPAPWHHIRFTQRPIGRLLAGVTPSEVAVLEVLRAGSDVIETDWSQLSTTITLLTSTGDVRTTVLHAAVNNEPHRGARSRWSELCRSQPELLAS